MPQLMQSQPLEGSALGVLREQSAVDSFINIGGLPTPLELLTECPTPTKGRGAQNLPLGQQDWGSILCAHCHHLSRDGDAVFLPFTLLPM